jgi:hypothetical protein
MIAQWLELSGTIWDQVITVTIVDSKALCNHKNFSQFKSTIDASANVTNAMGVIMPIAGP